MTKKTGGEAKPDLRLVGVESAVYDLMRAPETTAERVKRLQLEAHALALEEIEALHSGDGYGPKPLSKQERARISLTGDEVPGWVAAGLPEFVVEDFKTTFGDRWAEEAAGLMLPRAPIDLRVNGLLATVAEVEAELREAGLAAEPTPYSTYGLRLASEPPPNVQALEAFKAGHIEIQDEGSQIVSWLAGAAPGMNTFVFDLTGDKGRGRLEADFITVELPDADLV